LRGRSALEVVTAVSASRPARIAAVAHLVPSDRVGTTRGRVAEQ
jgi:hypothetical protein